MEGGEGMGCMMSRSRSTKNGDGESGEILRGRASDGSVWRASSLAFSAPPGDLGKELGLNLSSKGNRRARAFEPVRPVARPPQGPAPFLCVVLRLAFEEAFGNPQHTASSRYAVSYGTPRPGGTPAVGPVSGRETVSLCAYASWGTPRHTPAPMCLETRSLSPAFPKPPFECAVAL